MNLPHHHARLLHSMFAAGILFTSIFLTAAADRDRDPCARNLQTIWNGIQKYREQHKKLPLHLSELVPDHVASPNTMICPVTRRTGEIKNLGFSDPKLSSSYIYEFGNFKVPEIGEKTGFTLRDWRQLQMSHVGSIVPVLRCMHHPRVLNMSFDGKVYETAGDWESELANVVDPESLAPKAILAGIEFFATGIRAANIKTVDISNYYNVDLTDAIHNKGANGPSLKNLPSGRNKFRGIPFLTTGAIHLHGGGLNNILPGKYPTNVTDIVIGESAQTVHFLIGAGYNTQPGRKVGIITMNYEDGQSSDLILTYDLNIRDWWQPFPENNQTLKVAWEGSIGKDFAGKPKDGRVYMISWNNPRVHVPIKSINFKSVSAPAPFLLGVSVESP
jgi:hypothetical protein